MERIPQNLAPQWEKLDKSIVPSFPAPYVYGGICALDEKSVTAFERRARTYLRRGGVPVIGPDNYHAPGKLIPADANHPQTSSSRNVYRISIGEAYFDESIPSTLR